MRDIRCESITVQIIGTEYNAEGKPIAEHLLPAMKVFRAATQDPWAHADHAIAAAVAASEQKK